MAVDSLAASASCSGTIKSFNPFNGFGFVSYNGADIFVHKADCVDGQMPQTGDKVTFDLADNPKKPGSQRAVNVAGGTAPQKGVPGCNGSCIGVVKSFDHRNGWGFVMYEGIEIFVHADQCKGFKPKPGDTVAFDQKESKTKPGTLVCTNVTGGTGQPIFLETKEKGGKGGKKGWPPSYGAMWGSKGDWGSDSGWGGGW
eukprot:CAMPEP_0180769626 /NCGR_PEP_ID=MMETSP1038_2-20121128/41203_1 /TAXON_ID=632150 /ORGANISM="Azadinium spinosum, Strain 3D9" /LENGTH=198 /DNA_ID=CAMNT_0022804365 /DNA_START=13 /DNA_END=606 /DNA_ORIENTATION=+